MVKLELELEQEKNDDIKNDSSSNKIINIKEQSAQINDKKSELNNTEQYTDISDVSLYSSYEELIDSIGFNEDETVFSFEKEATITNFQRFIGYYLFSNTIMFFVFGLWFSLYFIPFFISLALMFYPENDKELLKLYSFSSSKIKNKLLLTKKIEAYKTDIYEKVLSVKENQTLILKHLDTFAKENAYKISNYFLSLIDKLKDAFYVGDKEESLQLLNEINIYMKTV